MCLPHINARREVYAMFKHELRIENRNNIFIKDFLKNLGVEYNITKENDKYTFYEFYCSTKDIKYIECYLNYL